MSSSDLPNYNYHSYLTDEQSNEVENLYVIHEDIPMEKIMNIEKKEYIVDRIYTIGEPELREQGKDITDFSKNLKQLFEKMYDIMKKNNGIGIAAQQIGLSLNCCVVDVTGCTDIKDICIVNGIPTDLQTISPLFICNPKITKTSGSSTFKEGCLSVPNFQCDVVRPEEIYVEFKDHTGKTCTIQCDGILARCMQHEFDHLNGVVFVDRLSEKNSKKYKKFVENNLK